MELYIRVNCIKSINDVKFLAVSQILRKNTISLEDIQSTFSTVRRLEIQRNASLRLSAAIDDNAGTKRPKIKKSKSKGNAFACLFCNCFGKQKKKKSDVQLANLVNESFKVLVFVSLTSRLILSSSKYKLRAGPY